MRSLFDEYECYRPEANEISEKAHDFVKKIWEEHPEVLARDIETVIVAAISTELVFLRTFRTIEVKEAAAAKKAEVSEG